MCVYRVPLLLSHRFQLLIGQTESANLSEQVDKKPYFEWLRSPSPLRRFSSGRQKVSKEVLDHGLVGAVTAKVVTVPVQSIMERKRSDPTYGLRRR